MKRITALLIIMTCFSASIYSSDAETYLKSANAKVRAQDYEGAIADYNKAIELDQKYSKAYYNRGLVRTILIDFAGAIQDFDKTLELDPKFTKVYYDRAKTKKALAESAIDSLIMKGNIYLEGAIDDLGKVLENDPANLQAYMDRAVLRITTEDYVGAIGDLNKILKLAPDFKGVYLRMGIAESRYLNFGEAIGFLNKAIEEAPNDSNGYYYRALARKGGTYDAFVFRKPEDLELIIKDLDKAIEINPKFAEAFYERGDSKYELGDEEGAKKDMYKAMELRSKNAYYWLNNPHSNRKFKRK